MSKMHPVVRVIPRGKLVLFAGSMVAIAALSLFLQGCGTVAKSVMLGNAQAKHVLGPDHFDRTVTHEGRVEIIGEGDSRITVLYVSGTPYEMGYQQGKLLSKEIHGTIHDVMAGAEKFLPKQLRNSNLISASAKRDIVNTIMDKAWQKMAPFAPPEDLQEMEGLADASGVPLQVIHRMHAIPDLGETSCSGLVAKETATRDGHVYQLRILDYGANFNLQRRPLITVYHSNDANAFANIGWIGFVGVISGVNDKGVAISEMGFGNPPGETLAGTPMPFLLKNVLRFANTADDGAAIVRAAPRTNSYIYFFGDKNLGAIGMITSAQRCLSYHANERDVLKVADHTLPQYRDVVYGGHYEIKQSELVSKMRGTIDAETLQGLAKQIAMKSNLQTVIYDLTGDKIWVANRKDTTRAADRPYVEFSLAKAFAPSMDIATGASAPTPLSTSVQASHQIATRAHAD